MVPSRTLLFIRHNDTSVAEFIEWMDENSRCWCYAHPPRMKMFSPPPELLGDWHERAAQVRNLYLLDEIREGLIRVPQQSIVEVMLRWNATPVNHVLLPA